MKTKQLQHNGEIIEFPLKGKSVLMQEIEAELFLESYY
jgi:hypothetical protein